MSDIYVCSDCATVLTEEGEDEPSVCPYCGSSDVVTTDEWDDDLEE